MVTLSWIQPAVGGALDPGRSKADKDPHSRGTDVDEITKQPVIRTPTLLGTYCFLYRAV